MVDPHAFMDALREFHHSHGEDLKYFAIATRCGRVFKNDRTKSVEWDRGLKQRVLTVPSRKRPHRSASTATALTHNGLAPIFNRKVMDLKKLWELVYAHGGSNQVCLKKRWASTGRCFNPPASMTNLSFHIKRIYEKFLLPFEQLHFPARAMSKPNETSSQSSSSHKAQFISPPFNSAVYIPKKRRSKLSRESRFAKNKKAKPLSNTLEPQGKRSRPQTKSIDPKEFAIPQTLVRPSTSLNIDDYEIQAVSALQEMKSLPRLANSTLKDYMVPSRQTSQRFFVDDYAPCAQLQQVRSNSAEECSFDGGNDILLSNGIRVIPVRSHGRIDSMMDCGMMGRMPPNGKTLMTQEELEIRLANIEERQRQDVESLSFQIQQTQAMIVRQEAKLQSVEATCAEVKQYLQALFPGLHRRGGTAPSNGGVFS